MTAEKQMASEICGRGAPQWGAGKQAKLSLLAFTCYEDTVSWRVDQRWAFSHREKIATAACDTLPSRVGATFLQR